MQKDFSLSRIAFQAEAKLVQKQGKETNIGNVGGC
jgi:hypothetical protein